MSTSDKNRFHEPACAALEHCRPALPLNENIASILAALMSVLLALGNNVICELHSVSLPLVMIERGSK
ncbi:MAG: hypothetical protein JSS89_05145 [Bacteroidetes bacterium]|nr:hypothetical protein [Bacteroidota bacterium]